MIHTLFDQPQGSPLQILCLGAHSDDIEIGCGGSLLKLMDAYPNSCITWVVFSATKEREAEAQASAHEFLARVNEKRIIIKDYRTSYFPYMGAEIKDYFEQLKQETYPDLIFSHYRQDLHQDHHLISDLTWNTFRDHLILEYEIPKYDGDLGSPNFFVHLDEKFCLRKINHLMAHFQTQQDKHWYTEDTFRAILRLRGIESASSSGYAEGFYCRKIVY